MKLVFTEFHPLTDLVQVNIHGALLLDWDKRYVDFVKLSNKYQQPSTGSGLSVSTVKLFFVDKLPKDLQNQIHSATINDGNGWIYILRSSQYNILYVGISEKSLAVGVFGDGRFRHHLRKLFAIKGGATNHTEGWHQHAKERYVKLCKLADLAGQPDRKTLLSDLYIAIAHVPDPKSYEKLVLNECAKSMDNPLILNRASNGLIDAKVTLLLPKNTPSS